MSFIRDDRQVALNELLVACEKSSDLLRDALSYCDDDQLASEFETLARSRDQVVQRLKDAIVAQGDLPSMPDLDSETSERIVQRISAAVAPAKDQHILEQRLDYEQHLHKLVGHCRDYALGSQYDGLIYELTGNIDAVKTKLEGLCEHGKH